VTVEVRAVGWAVLTIAKEPVNTMNLQLWQALSDALISIESNSAIRGLLIVSGLKRDIFTAGNDMNELHAAKTSKERYKRFWEVSNVFLARLYRSPLFTVAAIRGACPAAGCCIAMCCDYRIMTEKGHIGLNEVALGIPVPIYWTELFLQTVGSGPGEKLLKSGKFLTPAEALKLGLLDEVVPAAELRVAVEQVMAEVLKLPDLGRQGTKSTIRDNLSHRWEAGCVEESESGWQSLADPRTVKMLDAVLQSLSRSKGAKAKL